MPYEAKYKLVVARQWMLPWLTIDHFKYQKKKTKQMALEFNVPATTRNRLHMLDNHAPFHYSFPATLLVYNDSSRYYTNQ